MDLELLIFNMYKDTNIIGKPFKDKIKKAYKLKDIEISNIRARINKYQIEKYGSALEIDKGYKSKEECEHLSHMNNVRKNKRKKYERKVK